MGSLNGHSGTALQRPFTFGHQHLANAAPRLALSVLLLSVFCMQQVRVGVVGSVSVTSGFGIFYLVRAGDVSGALTGQMPLHSEEIRSACGNYILAVAFGVSLSRGFDIRVEACTSQWTSESM